MRVRQERISRVEKVFTTMDGRPEGSTDTVDGPECQEPRERQAEKSKGPAGRGETSIVMTSSEMGIETSTRAGAGRVREFEALAD